MFEAVITTPVAKLGIKTHDELLVGLSIVQADAKNIHPHTPLTKLVAEQLQAYFDKKLKIFSLPLGGMGTSFQKKVWDSLSQMECGTTKTYAELAAELETGPRAIGNACRRNPVVIIVPCHRIVAKNDLGGYSGSKATHWLDIKNWLLHHEQFFQ